MTLPVPFFVCRYFISIMKIHLETPEEIRHQIWKELGRATQDRHHEWRTPVLATVDQDGLAHARAVVIRSADPTGGHLCFYTDSRSPKVTQLRGQSLAQLVFWSARLSWQLRVRARVDVMTSGPEVEALWQRVRQSPSAGDYLSVAAPGEVLPEDGVAAVANEAVAYFAVLRAKLLEMDWLELSRSGHRRAKLSEQTWHWVTP